MDRLVAMEKIWKSLMGLTTFLLTFFVGKAYAFWRSVYELGRSIQGRMNDIGFVAATRANPLPICRACLDLNTPIPQTKGSRTNSQEKVAQTQAKKRQSLRASVENKIKKWRKVEV
jgi:hypothetical protein